MASPKRLEQLTECQATQREFNRQPRRTLPSSKRPSGLPSPVVHPSSSPANFNSIYQGIPKTRQDGEFPFPRACNLALQESWEAHEPSEFATVAVLRTCLQHMALPSPNFCCIGITNSSKVLAVDLLNPTPAAYVLNTDSST